MARFDFVQYWVFFVGISWQPWYPVGETIAFLRHLLQ